MIKLSIDLRETVKEEFFNQKEPTDFQRRLSALQVLGEPISFGMNRPPAALIPHLKEHVKSQAFTVKSKPDRKLLQVIRNWRPAGVDLCVEAKDAEAFEEDINRSSFREVLVHLKQLKIETKVVLPPDANFIIQTAELGVEGVKLLISDAAEVAYSKYAHAARVATDLGLRVKIGRGLSPIQVEEFLSKVPHIYELEIDGSPMVQAELSFWEAFTREIKTYLRYLKKY